MMLLRTYQNELMIAIAALVLLFGYSYKAGKEKTYYTQVTKAQHSLQEIKYAAALKDVWGTKKLEKKLKRFETFMPKAKTKLKRRGKKIEAKYSELTSSELNKLVTGIARLAVEITKLDIIKVDKNYNVEFECKW
jgi:CRISPR/Cas system endoribonuclease Cas6 (RAMP superfamily)